MEEEEGAGFEQLLQVQNQISNRRNAACVGQTMRVLVDGLGDDPEYPLTARTPGGKSWCGSRATRPWWAGLWKPKLKNTPAWALFGAVQAQ